MATSASVWLITMYPPDGPDSRALYKVREEQVEDVERQVDRLAVRLRPAPRRADLQDLLHREPEVLDGLQVGPLDLHPHGGRPAAESHPTGPGMARLDGWIPRIAVLEVPQPTTMALDQDPDLLCIKSGSGFIKILINVILGSLRQYNGPLCNG